MTNGSEPLNRRDLLASCLVWTGATCVTAFLAAGCEDDVAKNNSDEGPENVETLALAEITELAAAGGAVFKTFEGRNSGRPVLIVRRDATTFTAYTSVCTHQGCQVELPAPGENISCPCHDSLFSVADGSVLDGPATRALEQFPVAYDAGAGTVTITF